jgi:hypothetical protein
MPNKFQIPHRIYFSMPADRPDTPGENALKWAVVNAVEAKGYKAEISTDPRGKSVLSAGRTWSPEYCNDVIPRCVGAVVIGVPRFIFSFSDKEFRFATEYCHYEGALAYSFGLPILVLAENEIEHRGMFEWRSGSEIASFPKDSNETWVQTTDFTSRFKLWLKRLQLRRDVFLGYCSLSSKTAIAIREFLVANGVTVLDWGEFAPARSILEEITTASARCTAAIFLFTKDDALEGTTGLVAPRDNVVFEAGYFTKSKGKDRVLIIREEGSRMPADLGGDIYASLPNKEDISPIKETLLKFIKSRL